MRIVIPKTIADSDILYTNLVEDSSILDYSATTTYALDALCYVAATHSIYKSVSSSNVGHYPPDYISGASSTYWTKVAPLNKWAMFDTLTSTQSVAPTAATEDTPSEIRMTINAASCDAVFLANITGTDVDITLKDSSGNIRLFTNEVLSTRGSITNIWQFLFNHFTTRKTILTSLPYRWDSQLEIVVRNSYVGQYAKCGRLTLGKTKTLGKTQYKCTLSNKDFSDVTTDTYGNTTIVERDKATYIECTIDSIGDDITLDQLKSVLDSVQSVPTVWDFNNVRNEKSTNIECLTFYGYSTSTEISPEALKYNTASLKVYGLL